MLNKTHEWGHYPNRVAFGCCVTQVLAHCALPYTFWWSLLGNNGVFCFFIYLNENVNVVVCKVELEVASFTLMKACTRFYQAQRPHSNFICYYFLIISNRYLMSTCQVNFLKDMNILKMECLCMFVGVLLPKMSSLITFRLIEENLSLQGRSCLLLMASPNLKVPASRVVGEGP